jgi:ubiquinone biosynthesis protein COQ9
MPYGPQINERPAGLTADRIVDTALALAEQRSWEAMRLYEVAVAVGITLDDIRHDFREKEDLVDAWFDRADQAMLKAAEQPEFLSLPTRQRLHRLIMTWLGALAPHRRVTRQMILGKLELGHIHIQIPAIMRISRTVQWMREAAHRDPVYLRRALEETGLTTIYLMTFGYWLQDDSPGSIRTREFLERRLAMAETLSHWVFGWIPSPMR